MADEKIKVLVDTDFIKHIIDVKKTNSNGRELLVKIFDLMNYEPFVHQWVAENEFINSNLKSLVDDNVLKVVKWEEI